MTGVLAAGPQVLAAAAGSDGQTAAIWILGPISVLAALGLISVRKAVHSAMLLAVVMISLAVLYAVQDAPFLSAVQVIVYTGAVLMLFLFVLMLVGVDSSDSVVETIRGQRVLALLTAVVFGVLVVVMMAQVTLRTAVGLAAANANGNVNGLAQLLFTKWVYAFEVTSALLITAVLGAMVLAHRENIDPKPTQRDFVLRRMRDYAESGKHPGQDILPGVIAANNSVSTPARLADGSHVVMAIPGLDAGGPATAADSEAEEADVEEVARRARQTGEPT
jgi:NADH-quinone oxidoreductase subunit J